MSEPCRDCEACTGPSYATPEATVNPPGLAAIRRRVGRHGSFKASLLHGLGQKPALRDLTTREDDDPTIALADAWAAALDVLTFYQERISSEGYLGTATERRSVLELARAIGYELGGGVAASTLLAFEVEAIPGGEAGTTIPARTRARTIPGPGEPGPQTFETTEPLQARPEWNRLEPRRRASRPPRGGQTVLLVTGAATGLAAGDRLLIASTPAKGFDLRQIKALDVVPATDPALVHTRLTLDAAIDAAVAESDGAKAYVVRARAPLFGHNAPHWLALPLDFRRDYPGGGVNATEWPSFNAQTASGASNRLLLDSAYPRAMVDALAVVERPGSRQLLRIEAVAEKAASAWGLAGRGTLLTLAVNAASLSPREPVVSIAGEALDLFPEPIAGPIANDAIDLTDEPAAADELPGRWIVVRDPESGAGEAARVRAVDDATLLLRTPLLGQYPRASVEILANCAPATHGETIRPAPELLGSGDGAKAFQAFTLKRKPLTRVRAAAAAGSASTLEVRVDKVLWQEVPSLFGRGPEERVYTTRLADDGTVTVRFGDGRAGARLPTGQANIEAVYRQGTGRAGLLAAGRLDQLGDRPPGLKAVTSPLATEGAADPETLADARIAAPQGVLTLGRIVSVADAAAMALAFDGVGKAVATSLWRGRRELVQVSVIGDLGEPIAEASATMQALHAAVAAAAPEGLMILVQPGLLKGFGLAAEILLLPGRDPETVEAAIRAHIAETFGFAARDFAAAVHAGQVIAAIQAVDGVASVRLDALTLGGVPAPGLPSAGEGVLVAQPARVAGGEVLPAELLLIEPDAVLLEVRLP